MYKLVALDIDGTTLNENGKLTKYTKDTIHKCIDSGVPVCLCTGRNVHNTLSVIKELGIKTPFIAIDGAVMFDIKENKPVVQKTIPNYILKDLINFIDTQHAYMEFCTYNKYYKYSKSKDLDVYNYGGMPNNPKKFIEDYFKKNVRYLKKAQDILKKELDINMFLLGGEKDILDKCKEYIKSKGYEEIELRDNLWPNYIFVVTKGTKKSDGIKLLCEYYNIDISQVIAMGDQMNDIDMIQNVGMGIAMGNAHEKIKENANFITKTNSEDGVAFAIEKFIFNS